MVLTLFVGDMNYKNKPGQTGGGAETGSKSVEARIEAAAAAIYRRPTAYSRAKTGDGLLEEEKRTTASTAESQRRTTESFAIC